MGIYFIIISGVEKSKYINIISNACERFETHLYEKCYKEERNFGEAVVVKGFAHSEERAKKNMKTYDEWVKEHGSIKQLYTTPSLLQMMTSSNLYFLANEGDAILQESSFFNPSDTTADVKQGPLIDCK